MVARYRLGPEDPFPAAVNDAVAALAYVEAEGTDAAEIVIAGDSSGGGLAFSALLARKLAGAAMPAAAVGISPWVDLSCSAESLSRDTDLTVTRESLERMAAQYLGAADPADPLASPLYGDLAGLPPLLIVCGGDEALLDDAVGMARAAAIAGVDVTLRIRAGMQSIYPVYGGFLPEADEAIAGIGAWVRERIGG